MMGLGDTMSGEKLPKSYSPASRGSGREAELERMVPNGAKLVVVGGRPGWLFEETQPGKRG